VSHAAHAEIVMRRIFLGANVKQSRSVPWRGLLACVVLVASVSIPLLAADPPAASSGAAKPDTDAAAEARLETARRELEQAAHEVARLSEQLSTRAVQEVMPWFEPGRAIIGAQLEPTGDGAGARVREVSPGGPAAEAGIRTGDVIASVNGTPITGTDPTRQVVTIMHDVKPDSRVSVRVLREGKPRDFTLTARASPGLFATTHGGLPALSLPDLPQIRGAFMFDRPFMDMELATLTPRLGSYFGSDKGVLVVRAPADGALKLEDGDVILAIGGREPTSGSQATRILGSYEPGEKVTLRILRQHKTLELEATLPEKPGPSRKAGGRVPGPPQPRQVVGVAFGNSDL